VHRRILIFIVIILLNLIFGDGLFITFIIDELLIFNISCSFSAALLALRPS
jgi:hypothetical protein